MTGDDVDTTTERIGPPGPPEPPRPPELPWAGRPVYELRLRVRTYEVDALGHVNNAVYLNYLEQAATEHAEALDFGRERLAALGGLFVVRRHEIDYLGAALMGDELHIITWPESIRGPRAVRRYEVRHAVTGKILVQASTVWAWLDLRGRPRPVPREILDAFGDDSPATVQVLP